jgi:radical SAM superfamily enzyme YgiQ (UPF0313 family)
LSRVFVGVEFFRDQDLQYIRKGSTLRDNERAIQILQDLDIDIYASFIVRPEFDRQDFAELRRFCRRQKLDFASFAVLTPLPGTDLYQEVEDQLLTHNYDYFDFIHTLLPTRLPLKDFYRELTGLYRNAIPLPRALPLLKKWPARDIPGLLAKSQRVFARMQRLYEDYPESARGRRESTVRSAPAGRCTPAGPGADGRRSSTCRP